VSSDGKKTDKESWWWNQQVQEAVKLKKLAWKDLAKNNNHSTKELYREAKTRAKQAVAVAKKESYSQLYEQLDTEEGKNRIYSIAKQRDKGSKDLQQIRMINNKEGRVLTSEQEILERCKDYFEELMNIENPREQTQAEAPTNERNIS
jgi:ribosomal protein S8